MPAEPADRPVLDPDDIAGHGFAKARKGYEIDEVRAFLVGLGSRIRESQQQFGDMERRVAELERRAVDPKDLDEAAVTQLLGEETARVLDTARKAAAEIRAKAEEQSSAATEAADREATETRRAADQYAEGVRADADERVERTRTEADEYAAEVRRVADAETAEQRAAAEAYAADTRGAADTEVAELRTAATLEAERLRAEAETVLADRTAEAEVAAGTIRADADAYDHRTREEADRYAEATRAAADSYRADVQGAADAYRASATTEGDRLRAEAQADAEATRLAADADALARREAADAEAATIVADAREEGRGMVQEARTYRERVIADLADRRRAARAQFEQLAATRDALAVTLTDVTSRIESSHRLLQDATIDPGSIGDLAQDRRTLEATDSPGSSVGVGELADEPDGAGGTDADDDGDDEQPVWADDVVPEDVSPDDGAPEDLVPEDLVDDDARPDDARPEEDPDAVPDDGAPADGPTGADAAADLEATTGPSAAAAPAAEAEDPSADDEVTEDEVTEDEVAEDGVAEDGAPPVGEPSVDDIFARLRAEQGAAGAEADPDPETDADADADAVPVAVALAVAHADADADADADKAGDPDTDLLDLRDATTDELERQLARRLKRVLSDEQNEALDLLRRTRGTPGAAEVLPTDEEHLARYTSAALEDLASAERAGAAFFGSAPARKADVRDVATEFASEMVRQIRGRLERAFDDGGDENEVGERIRACYREWKTQRIADTARHYVVVAFSRGVAEAAADGAAFRWLVDDGDAPCPDCDDNALAGPTPKGEPFPTGDLCPPAHPGCRCLAVPVETA